MICIINLEKVFAHEKHEQIQIPITINSITWRVNR